MDDETTESAKAALGFEEKPLPSSSTANSTVALGQKPISSSSFYASEEAASAHSRACCSRCDGGGGDGEEYFSCQLQSLPGGLASARVWALVECLLRSRDAKAEREDVVSGKRSPRKSRRRLQPWLPLLTFAKQKDALAFADSFRTRLRRRLDPSWLCVWAEEVAVGGKRQFLCGCLRALVAPAAARLRGQADVSPVPAASGCTYSCCTRPLSLESGGASGGVSSFCSLYEVLESERPVWLFLDVEFDRGRNAGLCCSAVLGRLLLQLRAFLCSHCGLCVRDDEVVKLDSTSEAKFSHHLVFKAVRGEAARQRALWLLRDCALGEKESPKKDSFFPPPTAAASPQTEGLAGRVFAESTLFPDVQSAGLLIDLFLRDLQSRIEGEGEGAEARRVPCQLKECVVSVANAASREELLELFPIGASGERTPVVDCGVYTRNRCFRLLGSSKLGKALPLKISSSNVYPLGPVSELQVLRSLVSFAPACMKIPFFPESLLGSAEKGACPSTPWRASPLASFPSKRLLNFKTEASQSVPEWLEPVCGFVASVWQRELCEKVRHEANANSALPPSSGEWSGVFFAESRTLLVTPKGNRYCERIGRPHKSNAVFLVVSLREFAFCQKCHDADCRGFRSSPRLLPPALVQLLQSRAAEEAAPIQASFEAVQREAPFPPSETLKKTSQQQQQREGLLEGEATGASFRTDDFEQTADEEELDIAAAAVPDFENGSWT